MSDEPAFDENDLRSLGEKLAELDLTDRERAAMAALLSEDDVDGYGRFNLVAGVRFGWRANKGGRHGLHGDGLAGPQTFKPGRF